MAEGLKEIIADLRSALGIPGRNLPSLPPVDDNPPESEPVTGDLAQTPLSLPGGDGLASDSSFTSAEPVQVMLPTEEITAESIHTPEPKPVSPVQRMNTYAGMFAALLFALGVSWYVYFGGPRPPAPDVVATFTGGQITVQQVREHLAKLIAPQGNEPAAAAAAYMPPHSTYEDVIRYLVLDEVIRQWAEQQQLDTDARFAEAMRHVAESATLDEWVTELHLDEMTAAVSESDIQTYYDANKSNWGEATLTEVREQIRQTLAHQNQDQFFEDYIAKLRSQASIVRDFNLLEAPPPDEYQVEEYYQKNLVQFSTPQQVVVDVIYVPPSEFGEEADAAARARAEQALVALNTGKDFAQVASEYSQMPYSTDGLLLEEGEELNAKEDPQIVAQAFALSEAGELTPIFRTQAGYNLLRLREKRPASTLTLEEARPQILATLQTDIEKTWYEQNASRTLFTIQGERFTLGQFDHEFKNLPPDLQAQYAGPEGRQKLAEQLVDRLLILEDAYSRLLDQNNAPLMEAVRTLVLRQLIHDNEVNSKVEVTDQEVEDFYTAHQAEFSTPAEARIRSIRIYLGETEDEYQRSWDRAEAAYQQLNPGGGEGQIDFEAVAREFDESEQNPADAGLGEWIRMSDDIVQDRPAHPLHDYLLNLPNGTISQPFEFGDSVYIVKVLETKQGAPREFSEIKETIRKALEEQEHTLLDSQLAERLLSEARLTIYDQVLQTMSEGDRASPHSQP